MLSVIVVSRDRYDSFDRCLTSIKEYLTDVEICVGYDSDDDNTKKIALSHNANIFEFSRQKNRHSGYINPIAKECNGDFILSLNDDVEVVDAGDYQSLLLKHKHKLFYGICSENWAIGNAKADWEDHLKHRFACYPLISRILFNTLGFYMPSEVSGPGADIAFSKIIFNSNLAEYEDVPISIFDYGMSCSQVGHYNRYDNRCLNRDIMKINEFINNIS